MHLSDELDLYSMCIYHDHANLITYINYYLSSNISLSVCLDLWG